MPRFNRQFCSAHADPSHMSGEKKNLLGALLRLFRERRRHPRRRPREGERLLAGLSAAGVGESGLLFARVRDIGEGGLSAVVEGDAQGLAALAAGRALSLIVSLPEGAVAVRASLVYARPPGPDSAGPGHLIGARFTDISSVDLGRLRAYLSTLS